MIYTCQLFEVRILLLQLLEAYITWTHITLEAFGSLWKHSGEFGKDFFPNVQMLTLIDYYSCPVITKHHTYLIYTSIEHYDHFPHYFYNLKFEVYSANNSLFYQIMGDALLYPCVPELVGSSLMRKTLRA